MRRFTRGTIDRTPDNMQFYNRKGYTMTGETLEETLSDGTTTNYIVFSGSWTRSGTVRDCGNHFIIARYSRYDRVNKSDLSIIEDVEDR